jgi:dihydroorotate dehydrogenase
MIAAAYPLIRPMLFSLDAERAHEFTLGAVSRAPRLLGALMSSTPHPSLAFECMGLRFGGPIGLAAGLDKDGRAIPFWPALGFGFVEVGTVTAHPQPGNPKPRLFRLLSDKALINRMGFNNEGSAALAIRLRELRESGNWPTVPVGANVGKSKVTPLEDAVDDYATSVRRLKGLADYFTVNVSSPNTPGLRALQGRDHLERLLPAVLQEAGDAPVLLKLAPDLENEAIQEVADLAVSTGLSGLIATNTTIRRDLLTTDPHQAGGMSGRPLWPFARDRIQAVLGAVNGRIPVIGVGGVHSAYQAKELLDAGCAAVQLYSAMIYEGPGLIGKINRSLA